MISGKSPFGRRGTSYQNCAILRARSWRRITKASSAGEGRERGISLVRITVTRDTRATATLILAKKLQKLSQQVQSCWELRTCSAPFVHSLASNPLTPSGFECWMVGKAKTAWPESARPDGRKSMQSFNSHTDKIRIVYTAVPTKILRLLEENGRR